MDRAAYAREMFDLHQEMRDVVQVMKAEACSREMHDAADAMAVLVGRAEAVVEGYVASSPSGTHRA
jgi:hypothetical protein